MIGLSEYKCVGNCYLGLDLTWLGSHCENIIEQFVLPSNLSVLGKRLLFRTVRQERMEKS